MGRISDALKDKDPIDHPDTIQIKIAGEELPFFLGRRTFDLVKDHPDEPEMGFVEILEGGMESVQSDNPKSRMDQIGRMVWAGFLPFEPDLEYEVVSNQLSIGDLPRLAKTIRSEFDKLTEMANEVREEMGQDPAGKGSREPDVTETGELPEAAKA